jgi:limonene-1,2-epoxide hydrolase
VTDLVETEPKIEVIRRLQQALAARDKAAFLDFFAPEVEYHYHVGSRPLIGIGWVEKFITKYWADNSGATWVIERHAKTDTHLFTEGREEYVNADGETVRHPYMGIIHFGEDGKIVGWRDYFQMADPNATR